MAALITGGDGTLEANNWSRASKRSEQPKSPGSRPRIPSLDEVSKREEPKWTVFSGSQNLAAALNDPAYREYDLFTKTWGGYFIPNASLPTCNIPDIKLGDFIRYLKETAAVSEMNSCWRNNNTYFDTGIPTSYMKTKKWRAYNIQPQTAVSGPRQWGIAPRVDQQHVYVGTSK